MYKKNKTTKAHKKAGLKYKSKKLIRNDKSNTNI